MKDKYKRQLLWSARNRKAIQRLFAGWRRKPPRDLDAQFHSGHETAFNRIDCLACANCCKTTSPIFKERDIVRIAKHLGMKVADFSSRYLRRDEDGDWILQTAPCPFLETETNACTIYSERPQACREFPHTDRKNMREILGITEHNAHLCPAVSSVVQSILDEVNG